jgi:hypothetical protein
VNHQNQHLYDLIILEFFSNLHFASEKVESALHKRNFVVDLLLDAGSSPRTLRSECVVDRREAALADAVAAVRNGERPIGGRARSRSRRQRSSFHFATARTSAGVQRTRIL